MDNAPAALKDTLRRLSRPGDLYDRLPDGSLRCYACAHLCRIKDGRFGVCRVRMNEDGILKVPWGYVGALQMDPIEKKPFFHALPGSKALSFGMLGCDYHCLFCQNFITSQALRDPAAGAAPEELSTRDLADMAMRGGARVVASTYNEPLITSEWAVSVFRQAKSAGLRCAYVSNGNATPRVLDYIRPWTDFYKVDLKGFDDARYRRIMGGTLQAVLNTIPNLLQRGFWVEVVTLVIPTVNDSDAELKSIARFLTSVSRDLPWHVTAFHKDYKMTDPEDTPVETLLRAAEIGRAEGLRYVYAGNLPGRVGDWENTRCPSCGLIVVERRGFRVLRVALRLEGPKGCCPSCAAPIAGVWA